MTALHVKDMPEALMRRTRATAFGRGETVRDFVIRALKVELLHAGADLPSEPGGEGIEDDEEGQ